MASHTLADALTEKKTGLVIFADLLRRTYNPQMQYVKATSEGKRNTITYAVIGVGKKSHLWCMNHEKALGIKEEKE